MDKALSRRWRLGRVGHGLCQQTAIDLQLACRYAFQLLAATASAAEVVHSQAKSTHPYIHQSIERVGTYGGKRQLRNLDDDAARLQATGTRL